MNTIDDDAVLPAIVKGLLDLGRTLNLEIVAEGVELGTQRDALRSEHCGYGQGFLFGHPLTVHDVGERLATSNLPTSEPALPV